MARNENDDTKHIKTPDVTPTEELYNITGEITTNTEDITCARKVFFPSKNRTQYYVLYGGDHLYNPEAAKSDVRYKKRSTWKMKEVQQRIFNQYLLFLQTKKTLFLRNAEREI